MKIPSREGKEGFRLPGSVFPVRNNPPLHPSSGGDFHALRHRPQRHGQLVGKSPDQRGKAPWTPRGVSILSGTSPRTHPARVPTWARCPPSKGEYFHLSGHEDHLGRRCSIRLKTETVKEKVPTDQENLARIGTFGCVRELIFSQGRQ